MLGLENLKDKVLSKKNFYSLCFCGFALLCSLGIWGELTKQPDSESYLMFSDEILSLELFDRQEASWATTIRAPAYPALMAIARLIGGDNSVAILSLHFLFAFAALSFFVLRFSPLISSQAAILLGFLSLFVWREYYYVILTEWISLCSLMVFLCILPLRLEELTGRRFLSIGLMTAFMILLRPAFICLLPVVVGLILIMVPKENFRQAFTVLLVGLLPVFMWAVFNLYRLNTFTIAAFSGHNLFGNASLVGYVTPDSNDSMPSRFTRFVEYVNRNKIPGAGKEHQFLSETLVHYQSIAQFHNNNVYKVALNFAPSEILSRVEYDSLMKEYALKVIFDNPRAYLSLFVSGLGVAKRDIWLMLIAVVSLFMMIKNGHQMSIVLGVALAAHISHLMLVSLIQINIERYYMLTLVPLGVLTVAGLLSALGFNKIDS